MEVEEKELLIKEIKSFKDEVSTNVTRTIFSTYATGVGALGLVLQYSDLNINQYFHYYNNFLSSSKLAPVVPITLLGVGVPLTAYSIKEIVKNSTKAKVIEKEYKKKYGTK